MTETLPALRKMAKSDPLPHLRAEADWAIRCISDQLSVISNPWSVVRDQWPVGSHQLSVGRYQ